MSIDSYLVAGNGRWGDTVLRMLNGLSRSATQLGGWRRRECESGAEYLDRCRRQICSTESDVVWLCLPPSADLPLLIESALLERRRVIVEKPWLASRSQTDRLLNLAEAAGRPVNIDFEFCLLPELVAMSNQEPSAEGWFSADFVVSGPNRLAIPAAHNLGSHLAAIRQVLFPNTLVRRYNVGYRAAKLRTVTIEASGETRRLDFTGDSGETLRRFTELTEGASGPTLDLRLALSVAVEIRDCLANNLMFDVSGCSS